MEQDTRLLRNPQGTEGLLLKEAYSHLKRVNKVENIFLSWGYLPSKTPVFDYFEVYKEYLGENRENFRLFDREGELLVLRSDITLFLAKQLGMSLCEGDLPVRTFYADSILRHQKQTDISKNEFFQIGAELVGEKGMRGDAEILALMTEILEAIGVDYYCHIGSRQFFDLAVASLSAEQKEEAVLWIDGREFDRLEGLLAPALGAGQARAVAQLFASVGNIEAFKTLFDSFRQELSKEQVEVLTELIELFKILETLSVANRFRIDLSEIGKRAYYTGISFSVYAEGADSAVASGGRYDELL